MKDRFRPPVPPGPIRIVGRPMPAYEHSKSLERERERAWEDEQLCRKLDYAAMDGPVGRYMLVRSRRGRSRPYAAVFLRANEDPAKVAEKLGAEVLELVDDCRLETADRLEAERDRLNAAAEVMES